MKAKRGRPQADMHRPGRGAVGKRHLQSEESYLEYIRIELNLRLPTLRSLMASIIKNGKPFSDIIKEKKKSAKSGVVQISEETLEEIHELLGLEKFELPTNPGEIEACRKKYFLNVEKRREKLDKLIEDAVAAGKPAFFYVWQRNALRARHRNFSRRRDSLEMRAETELTGKFLLKKRKD